MVKKNNLKESKEIKMQTHFLNETSVRTSVNYGINNIKIYLMKISKKHLKILVFQQMR